MTYLVMECHPAYVIVLDQAGRVIKAANIGYDMGQRIDHIIPIKSEPKKPLLLRFAPLAAAACLCAAVLGSGAWSAFFLPYGIVEMSINPHISMDVSYMDRVVGLNGLNDDGIRLIENVDYKGKSAEEMAELLTERAVDMGYLTDGGAVRVTASSSSLRWSKKREAVISEELTLHFKDRVEIDIVTGEAPAPAAEPESLPAALPLQPSPSAPPESQEVPPPESSAPAAETRSTLPPAVHSISETPAAAPIQSQAAPQVHPVHDDDDMKPGDDSDDWDDDNDDSSDDDLDDDDSNGGDGDDD